MILFFSSILLALFVVGILCIPRIIVEELPCIEPVEDTRSFKAGMPRDSRGRFTKR